MKSTRKELESYLENKIKKYLKDNYPNALIYKTNVFGMPDILILYKGKFIAYEVKRLKGVAKPHQLLMIDKINSNGGFARIVNTFESFKEHWDNIMIET